MKKTIFITGATSGIGEATARLFAAEGVAYRLIICGRRKDRLENLKEELSLQTEVYSLSFDVRQKKDVFQTIESLPADWKQIDILVNNAGNAHGLAAIQDGDVEDWDAMMDINVKGLLYVSKAIIPGMVERKRGHIINISSIAGKEVYPKGNVYCASKFAVDAITKGMLMDLNPFGIKVTSINPGMVETEFSKVRFKGDEEKAKAVYQGLQPLTAKDIADQVMYVAKLPAHMNISDITVLPIAQASATVVNRKV